MLYSAYLRVGVLVFQSLEKLICSSVCVLVFCVCSSDCVSKSVCARVFAFMSVYEGLYVFE